MKVVSQDRDTIITPDKVDYEPVYSVDTKILWGFNIFGYESGVKHLLGTVEDDVEAIGIVSDINVAKVGDKWYYLPTDLDHLDDEEEDDDLC